jgi:hypothetical protein
MEKETITKQQREAQKLMVTGLEIALIIFERPKNEWPQDGCAIEVGCYPITDRNLKIYRLEYKRQGLTNRKLVTEHPVVHLLAIVEPNAV